MKVDRERAAKMVLDGKMDIEIAKVFGVTPAAITHAIRALTGMTPTEYRRAHGWVAEIPPEEIDRMVTVVETYDELGRPGTVAMLAQETGRGGKSISEALASRGVYVNTEGRRRYFSNGQRREIVRLYLEEGWTCQAIGDQFSVEETTIRRTLTRMKIKRRRKGHRGAQEDRGGAFAVRQDPA